jgi:hypothetical protein
MRMTTSASEHKVAGVDDAMVVVVVGRESIQLSDTLRDEMPNPVRARPLHVKEAEPTER